MYNRYRVRSICALSCGRYREVLEDHFAPPLSFIPFMRSREVWPMGGLFRRRPAVVVVVRTYLQAVGGSRGKGRLIGHGWGQWAGRQKKALKRLPHL
jgi:hypothetical protein